MAPKPRARRNRKTAAAGGSPRAVRSGQKPPSVPAAFQRIVADLSRKPRVTIDRGWRSTGVAVKVRNKIVVMLVNDEVVMKLPKTRVDELVASAAGTRFDPRRDGRLMKEWVVIPLECAEGRSLAREAHRFALRGDDE